MRGPVPIIAMVVGALVFVIVGGVARYFIRAVAEDQRPAHFEVVSVNGPACPSNDYAINPCELTAVVKNAAALAQDW